MVTDSLPDCWTRPIRTDVRNPTLSTVNLPTQSPDHPKRLAAALAFATEKTQTMLVRAARRPGGEAFAGELADVPDDGTSPDARSAANGPNGCLGTARKKMLKDLGIEIPLCISDGKAKGWPLFFVGMTVDADRNTKRPFLWKLRPDARDAMHRAGWIDWTEAKCHPLAANPAHVDRDLPGRSDLAADDIRRGLEWLDMLPEHPVRRMLAFQATRVGAEATATELAEAAGYGLYSAVNLHYSGSVKRFCREFGYPEPQDTKADEPGGYWPVFSLGDVTRNPDATSNTVWKLRPPAREAIESLGWDREWTLREDPVAIDTAQSDTAQSDTASADELDPDQTYPEGLATQVTVNRYEPDAAARTACLDAHGTDCVCCGIDLEDRYGPVCGGFIAVHHLHPLARGTRQTDPVGDLVPVCFNCHAVMHRRRPEPYSVNEVRSMLDRRSDRRPSAGSTG